MYVATVSRSLGRQTVDDRSARMLKTKCNLIAACLGLYYPPAWRNPPSGDGGYGELATEATGAGAGIYERLSLTVTKKTSYWDRLVSLSLLSHLGFRTLIDAWLRFDRLSEEENEERL
jgi:hypothetical protein